MGLYFAVSEWHSFSGGYEEVIEFMNAGSVTPADLIGFAESGVVLVDGSALLLYHR